MKANKIGQEETISVLLTRNAFPIAFQNKLDELMEQGAFNSEEEATRWIESNPIVLEIMYAVEKEDRQSFSKWGYEFSINEDGSVSIRREMGKRITIQVDVANKITLV